MCRQHSEWGELRDSVQLDPADENVFCDVSVVGGIGVEIELEVTKLGRIWIADLERVCLGTPDVLVIGTSLQCGPTGAIVAGFDTPGRRNVTRVRRHRVMG